MRCCPTSSLDIFVLRVFIGGRVAGAMLAAAYLALNPPRTEPFADLQRAPVRQRFEWLVPVMLVNGVFLVFVAAQASVVFGGHDYVQRTTGLTYADYVHQGFGQLTVATLLTLLVVWAASQGAGATPADRLWLRGLARPALRAHPGRGRARRCTGCTSTRRPTASPGSGCSSTSSRAGSGCSCVAVAVAGLGLSGWWLPRARW